MDKNSNRDQCGDAPVQLPQRNRAELFRGSLDQSIREDCLARTVGASCESFDQSELCALVEETQHQLSWTPIGLRILNDSIALLHLNGLIKIDAIQPTSNYFEPLTPN